MAVKTNPTESLRQVPLFAGLDRKELEMLSKLVKEQRYNAGATIVKSGAGGHGLYIIKEGNIEVIRDGHLDALIVRVELATGHAIDASVRVAAADALRRNVKAYVAAPLGPTPMLIGPNNSVRVWLAVTKGL